MGIAKLITELFAPVLQEIIAAICSKFNSCANEQDDLHVQRKVKLSEKHHILLSKKYI